MIQSRIREIRRSKGLTLQQVAERAGTTAQTIGRLETGMRTLSINWVRRIAEALEADPSELLSLPGGGDIIVSGEIAGDGLARSKDVGTITPRLAASDPVAYRVKVNMGQYRVGDTILFDRLDSVDLNSLAGRDCLVTLEDERQIFCRYAVSDDNKTATVMPLAGGAKIIEKVQIREIAPAVMLLRKLPG